MNVKIYKTSKNAMQSGRGKVGQWILEYERESARRPEPLMGWSASADTNNQVRLIFDTEQEAIHFAEENNLPYDLKEGSKKRIRPRNYGDNFRYFPPED